MLELTPDQRRGGPHPTSACQRTSSGPNHPPAVSLPAASARPQVPARRRPCDGRGCAGAESRRPPALLRCTCVAAPGTRQRTCAGACGRRLSGQAALDEHAHTVADLIAVAGHARCLVHSPGASKQASTGRTCTHLMMLACCRRLSTATSCLRLLLLLPPPAAPGNVHSSSSSGTSLTATQAPRHLAAYTWPKEPLPILHSRSTSRAKSMLTQPCRPRHHAGLISRAAATEACAGSAAANRRWLFLRAARCRQ